MSDRTIELPASTRSTLDEAYWRLPTVTERIGLGRDAIYEMEAAGRFPRRRQIGERAVAWLASEVIDWMRSRPVAVIKPGTPIKTSAGKDSDPNTMTA